MVQTVVKRNGSKEAFSEEKIAASVAKVGAPGDVARMMAQGVRDDPNLGEETTSADIRALVLMRLQRTNLAWDHAWREHEYEVKKRSMKGGP